jgi:hypothetical protein
MSQSKLGRACLLAVFLIGFQSAVSAQSNAQITVLYDAFGGPSTMQRDWGYAAFIEYRGKRILFDTGNNPIILAQNAKAKGISFISCSTRR